MEAILRLVAGRDINEMPFDEAVKLYNQCLYYQQFQADMIAQSVMKAFNNELNIRSNT